MLILYMLDGDLYTTGGFDGGDLAFWQKDVLASIRSDGVSWASSKENDGFFFFFHLCIPRYSHMYDVSPSTLDCFHCSVSNPCFQYIYMIFAVSLSRCYHVSTPLYSEVYNAKGSYHGPVTIQSDRSRRDCK